jgi:hypothetical protein
LTKIRLRSVTVNIRARVQVAGIALLAATLGRAQEPDGYTRATMSPLPDSLQEVRNAGRFTLTIQRVAADTAERRLIEYAESLVPPRESIERAAAEVTGAGHVAAFKTAAQLPGARWWWREWDSVLLPYALTGAAVQHYLERMRALADGPNLFGPQNPLAEHRGSLAYSARIVRPPERPGIVEAHLHISFSFFCGPLCALSFSHSRVVQFDAAGRVLRVIGDKPPGYVVS